MTKMIKKSMDTVKQGIKSLKNIKKDKREYKEYLKRIKALPDDYQFVFEKMTKYMWSRYGGGNGYDMLSLQGDLLELFEASEADGKEVFQVTGKDVSGFCDELLRNANTYTENQEKNLNKIIMEKLGKKI
ncbi:MAG: DUF1048 domain-containing protein [Anaerovoracaceae bacterium]